MWHTIQMTIAFFVLLTVSNAGAAMIDLAPVYQSTAPVELPRVGPIPQLVLARPLTGSFAVEFVFKFNEDSFARLEEGRFMQPLSSSDNCVDMRLDHDGIEILSKPQAPVAAMKENVLDRLSLDFRGSVRRSLSYYLDFKEHHFVVQRDAAKGFLQLWVDGIAYTVAASPGNLLGSCGAINLSSTKNTDRFVGTLSKVAVYDRVLGPSYIRLHSSQRTNPGFAYDFKMRANDINRYLVNASVAQAKRFDTHEYVPGSVIPTVGFQTQGSNLADPLTQFHNAPNPRYQPMSVPFQRNFNWLGVYLSGWAQNWLKSEYDSKKAVDPTVPKMKIYALRKYAEIQKELATTFNYGVVSELNVNLDNVSASGPTLTAGPVIRTADNEAPVFDLMRAHPEFSRDFIMFGAFTNNLVDETYWLTHSGTQKYLLPMAPKSLASLNGQAIGAKLDYFKKYIDDAGANNAGRTGGRVFDRLNDNGEYGHWAPNESYLLQDPRVVQDEMTFSGETTPANGVGSQQVKEAHKTRWQRYRNSRLAEFVNALRDGVLSVAGNNITYSLYSVTAQGNNDGYEFLKKVNTPYSGMDRGCNSSVCYYPTADFYPRSPDNWSYWSGAWHGLKWLENGHRKEIAANDRMMSPFVNAGWSTRSEDNQTPSQYLGELKLLMALGTEFFYAGYFTLGDDLNNDGVPDFGDSRLWAWQALAPAYAQAAFSSVSDFIRKGDLVQRLPGGSWEPENYRLTTSDPRAVVYARKLGTKYLIVSSIQPLSNVVGNAPMSKTITFDLEGSPVQIVSRRQGSIYVLDKTNPAKPTLKQVDAWHAAGHFAYWPKAVAMEAENSDNQLKHAYLETRFLTGEDRLFETLVRFKGELGSMPDEWLQYSFQPRSERPTSWNLRVKAKTVDASPAYMAVRLLKSENRGWSAVGNESRFTVRSQKLSVIDLVPFGMELERFGNYRIEIRALSPNLALDNIEVSQRAFTVPMVRK